MSHRHKFKRFGSKLTGVLLSCVKCGGLRVKSLAQPIVFEPHVHDERLMGDEKPRRALKGAKGQYLLTQGKTR